MGIKFGLSERDIEFIDSELEHWIKVFADEETNPMYIKDVWESIAAKMAWDGFTLCLYYMRHKEEEIFGKRRARV